MESFQKLLAKVSTQLRDLTRTQSVTILLGGVLAAVLLVWMIQWAARSEMVPLLNQDLDTDELARVQVGLELSSTPFKLVGNRIMVRADASPHVLLAQLQQQGKLPSDTSAGFQALVKESNPWISQAEHERRWTVALKHEIEQVLRQFNGVRSASVFLPMNSGRRRFSRVEPATSASITLIMAGGQPVTRELALAAARMVSGAVRGLALKNIEVLDGNGTSALDWESEASGATALDRQRRKHERDIRAKILSQLPDPKARVQTQVELELTDQSVQTETPSKPVEIHVETTSEETARARPSGQPGVQPNVGVTAGARVADESTSKETSITELIPAITRTKEVTPPGGIKEISAAVYISSSYLSGVYQRSNPEVEEPTEEQIEQAFEREKQRIVSQVTKLVKPQDEEHVAVNWYYDTPLNEEPATQASTLDETFQMVWRYGPQSGLALLAFLSLGMMLRMARKSDSSESFGLEIGLPKEAIAAAQQAARDIAKTPYQGSAQKAATPTSPVGGEKMLAGDPAAIGQAAMTEGILVAQEVDERTVQTNKMLDQVTQVVESDADAAAGLLEQWMARSDTYES